MGTIYLLINKSNGNKYVGKTTKGSKVAWQTHLERSRRMSAHPLHRAIRKHGAHMFLLRDLCECSPDELDEKKQEFIEKYNTFGDTGYNEDHNAEEIIIPEEVKEDDTAWGFYDPKNRSDGKHSAIPLLCINIETGEKKEYKSSVDAAIDIKGDRKYSGNISTAANKGRSAYGYRWKKLKDKSRSIPIYGVHKVTWEETRIFSSIKEASRIIGADEGSIRKSVYNPYKYSCKRYFWFKSIKKEDG